MIKPFLLTFIVYINSLPVLHMVYGINTSKSNSANTIGDVSFYATKLSKLNQKLYDSIKKHHSIIGCRAILTALPMILNQKTVDDLQKFCRAGAEGLILLFVIIGAISQIKGKNVVITPEGKKIDFNKFGRLHKEGTKAFIKKVKELTKHYAETGAY